MEYSVIMQGLCTQSWNHEGGGMVCSLAEIEPPGLGFAWGLSNGSARGWRGVYLSGIQCDCAGLMHMIMES